MTSASARAGSPGGHSNRHHQQRLEGAEIQIPLGMRIGISTSPVIRGVIGSRGFSFDVWGDTVNLANRMETSSVAGRIQVSEATDWRLQPRYTFEVRDVEIKGGERIRAYLLVGHQAA